MRFTSNFCFHKSQRLLTPKDYQAVFNHTVNKVTQAQFFKIHQDNLLIFTKFYLPTKTPKTEIKASSRLGLAITKKKVKRAHERNRLKRLAREYFRLHHHELIGRVDIVLTIKHFSEELTNEVFVQQLANAFKLINEKVQKIGLTN